LKIKNIVRWIRSRFRQAGNTPSKRSSSTVPTNSTLLIHIGKCGGRTLKQGLRHATRNTDVLVVHIRKPVYRPDLKYIVVARGPIDRLVSAFRWRYKLVVTDGSKREKFAGERDILMKYGNLNNLAEALYHKDGSANSTAQVEIRKIHHIREDISFYLKKLLSRCHPDQIVAVLMQENLDADILRVFGYENQLREHENLGSGEDFTLSDIATRNLKLYFSEDYEALSQLHRWGKIKREVFLEATE
jgi:hypothetical protein